MIEVLLAETAAVGGPYSTTTEAEATSCPPWSSVTRRATRWVPTKAKFHWAVAAVRPGSGANSAGSPA